MIKKYTKVNEIGVLIVAIWGIIDKVATSAAGMGTMTWEAGARAGMAGIEAGAAEAEMAETEVGVAGVEMAGIGAEVAGAEMVGTGVGTVYVGVFNI